MNGVERLREYAESVRLGGECRILHARHGDASGDFSDRECGDCRAAYLRAIADEVERSALPEGTEWLLEVWPRWSSGEYCRFGDWWTADRYGDYEPRQFRRLVIYTPELLDADGNRIETGMDVWWICDGDEFGIHAERLHVDGIDGDGMVECSPYNGGTSVVLEPSELHVHRPVLDADGADRHMASHRGVREGHGEPDDGGARGPRAPLQGAGRKERAMKGAAATVAALIALVLALFGIAFFASLGWHLGAVIA